MQLIDRLEQLVSSGTRLPLSSRTMIDEQAFLDIVDQLRVTVPEELKQARRFTQDRDRVMQQAEAEAEKMMSAAQQQIAMMIQESEVLRRAQGEAQRTIAAAEDESEAIRRGADEYAADVLGGLEAELNKLVVTTRKGRATLDRSVHRGLDGYRPVEQ